MRSNKKTSEIQRAAKTYAVDENNKISVKYVSRISVKLEPLYSKDETLLSRKYLMSA